LILCLLAALIAAVGCAVAVRREPPTLSVLQDSAYPHYLQQWGGMVGTYLVAVVVGVVFAVVRR
jgi:hypothetical protein